MPRRRPDVSVAAEPTAAGELEVLLDPAMPEAQRRIVVAAIATFADQGFHATATSEIARRAGVAEGTIFRYYRTKKALLVGAAGALFMRALTPIVRRGIEHIFATEHETFADLVRAVAADRLSFAQAHPTLLRLLVQEIPFHPELREQFRATVFADVFPLALAAIERFQARGEIADLPPATVARIVASVLVGYVLNRVFVAADGAWDDAAEIEIMARVLSRGLAPP